VLLAEHPIGICLLQTCDEPVNESNRKPFAILQLTESCEMQAISHFNMSNMQTARASISQDYWRGIKEDWESAPSSCDITFQMLVNDNFITGYAILWFEICNWNWLHNIYTYFYSYRLHIILLCVKLNAIISSSLAILHVIVNNLLSQWHVWCNGIAFARNPKDCGFKSRWSTSR